MLGLKNAIFLVGFIFLAELSSYGQKVYFVYLQTENQQPFFARVNDKTLNSNTAGYLILPNLRDSSYDIQIGFPGNQWPEQRFKVLMNKKDHGFLLKNFNDQGWGLFNLQTLAVTMPSQGKTDIVVKKEKRETTDFTDLLAKAADDSTLKDKPVIVKTVQEKPETKIIENPVIENTEKYDSSTHEIPVQTTDKQAEKPNLGNRISEKKDSLKIADIPDSPKAKMDTVTLNKEAESAEEIIPESQYKKSNVKLVSESSTTQGLTITFFDSYADGKTDTIKILIPPQSGKALKIEDKPNEQDSFKLISADSVFKKVQESSKSDEKKLIQKNNCANTATEEDFFRLRKNMAAETGTESMLEESRKAFRNKCYTTLQIRNLSTLFLTDESKYRFFDTAYSYSSDEEKYSELIAELRDEYYINRFKAMLR